MLAGCFIRNFKVYSGVSFIPLCSSSDKFTVFTGTNGAGKSSVFEALDHFFNGHGWVRHHNAKKDEVYVAPIFLLEKSEYKKSKAKNYFETISDYMWSISESPNHQVTTEFTKFLNWRNDLSTNITHESHYLIILGIKSPNNDIFFGLFNEINKTLKSISPGVKDFNNSLLEHLRKKFSYIYLPVEISASDILRLESKTLQSLMDIDVVSEIDEVLKQKLSVEVENNQRKDKRTSRKKNQTPLDIINHSLSNIVENINNSIRQLDKSYSFTHEKNTKKDLTPQDIRDIILNKYLSIRTLKKGKTNLKNMSSGEKRLALFDIAYSLLSQGYNTSNKLILAIDEPEASLHMNQCHKQFMKYSELSEKFSHQVLITTHWYGFLPVLNAGYLNHIDEERQIAHLNLESITSSHKYMPDEIELKSMFDLVSSILGMLRAEKCNWLICEGMSDKLYLEHILGDSIPNLHILPVGSNSNVVKFYDYLVIPFSEKSEKKKFQGKILCLIDTDSEPKYPISQNTQKLENLSIRRLNISLNQPDSIFSTLNPHTSRNITCIEDLLNPEIFYESVVKFIAEKEPSLIDATKSSELNKSIPFSGFSDNMKCIKGTEMVFFDSVDAIISVINDNKVDFCKAYINTSENRNVDYSDIKNSFKKFF